MPHTRVAEDFVEVSCVERVPVMDEISLSPQETAEVVDQVLTLSAPAVRGHGLSRPVSSADHR